MDCGVWGLGLCILSLGFGFWGFGSWVCGVGSGVWDLSLVSGLVNTGEVLSTRALIMRPIGENTCRICVPKVDDSARIVDF